MGKILTKNVFLLKMSLKLPNSAFLLFCNIFGLIHWKLLFLVKKMNISQKSTEILRIFFFNKFEKGQTKRKVWICLNNSFWTNQYKGININKNYFSPQNEPHTAKLWFSFDLKHFRWNLLKIFLFSLKSVYLR